MLMVEQYLPRSTNVHRPTVATTTMISPIHRPDNHLYILCRKADWVSVGKFLPVATEKHLTYMTNGSTALHAACARQAPPDIIKEMMRRGMDSYVVGKGSVLFVAVTADASREVIEILLHAGPDLDYIPTSYINSNKFTAILLANMTTLRLLLEHGANPNKGDDIVGFTPLHHYVKDYEENGLGCAAIQLLLDHGADPNLGHFADLHETPLHFAAKMGISIDVVLMLLNYGADVTIVSDSGKNAMDLAIEGNHTHLWSILTNPPLPSKGGKAKLTMGPVGTYCLYCFKSSPTGEPYPKCKGCGIAHYCGIACAKAHWPVHKEECGNKGKGKKTGE